MSESLKALINQETKRTNEELQRRHPGFAVGNTSVVDGSVWYGCTVHDGAGKNHRKFGVGIKLTGEEGTDKALIEMMFRNARASDLA